MTKKDRKKDTEQLIVDKALAMFNESGIEYVGMRELAAALDLRIGNVTYYFPTKDDLVYRIAGDLTELNSKTIVQAERLSMKECIEMLRQVFHNHSKYRCLMLSFVHLMAKNPFIAKRYKAVQKTRKNVWQTNVEALEKSGYIKTKNEREVKFLVSSISFIARFWISEAAVSYRDIPESEQSEHYLEMILRIMLPFATEKGKRDLMQFL